MNNKVKFLRGTATEYEASTKDNDTFYYTTDDEKLYLGNKEITGGGVTIDDTLSDTSKNPVQNKVITNALNNKADLSDIPSSLPANGGNADTLNGRSTTGINSLIRYTDGNYDCNTTISTGVYRGTFTNYPSSLPDGQGILLVMNYHGANSEVSGTVGTDTTWLRQWFISPHGYSIYERLVINTTVTAWTPINDGGNAATLESHPASDFALKTEIPTTLPANGGRSDSTSHQINHYLGQGIDVLTYAASDDCPHNVNTKVRIMHSPTCPTNYGYNAADNDFWYDIYKLDNSWVQIKAYDIRGNVEFINSCCNGTWKGWIRCNDGGNAATANFATYSDYAGGSVQSTASNVCLRNISAGTADLSAGVSELATGAIYLVYE